MPRRLAWADVEALICDHGHDATCGTLPRKKPFLSRLVAGLVAGAREGVAKPPNGSYPMGMQILTRLFKTADVSPIAQSRNLPSDWADFSDRLCVLASQGPGGAESRGDKLYSCENARLLARELNSEWPGSNYWAALATAHEIKAHAVQAARLIARERRYPRFPKAVVEPRKRPVATR
jgi:hypothetical protein